MLGLDTNVLLRYLVRDDEKQARTADARIAEGAAENGRFFVNHVVLCELAWTLDRTYGLAREDIAVTIQCVLSTAQFVIEEKQDVVRALQDFSATGADFADCLIGRKNASSGCDRTLTFDKRAKGLSAFELI